MTHALYTLATHKNNFVCCMRVFVCVCLCVCVCACVRAGVHTLLSQLCWRYIYTMGRYLVQRRNHNIAEKFPLKLYLSYTVFIVYNVNSQLLNLFPEEAGEKKNRKGRKARIIPYLPGRLPE